VQSTETLLEQAVQASRIDGDVADRIRRWLLHPAYAEFSEDVAALIEADDIDELVRLFWREIPFGTGGRRGVMGSLGTATINARTIAESAHGLAEHLKDSGLSGGPVAVAYDTRHRSSEFARLTATTLAAHGFPVLEFDGFRATPTLSFAVGHLDCVAGVVISASHNPPSDNGFKAYWSHGGQVLPPHDAGIVDCVARSETIPTLDYDQAVADGRIKQLGPEIDLAYQQAVLATRLPASSPSRSPANLPVLFTPLNGVGGQSIPPVLHAAGFSGVELFAEQAEPDGDFSSVPDHLPNPERFEVFGPAIAAARDAGHALVMASDPDADRLAVAAPDIAGNWQVLTGNQLAAILLDHILRHRSLPANAYALSTLVTTPMIGVLCRSHGVEAVDDLLVGFKHISREIESRGPAGFVFGCEESIGYLAGTYCRDKDAAGAALLVADIALELHGNQQTLWHRLDEIFDRHGRVDEFQHAVYAHGPAGRDRIESLMRALRDAPPLSIGGHHWQRVRDYDRHEIRRMPENSSIQPLPNPSSNLLVFESDPVPTVEIQHPLVTLAARPSGTEPKIKFYGFARQPRPGQGDTHQAIVDLQEGLARFLDEQRLL
jgi:phosphoglucomutase/phosphomannomutase